LDEADAVQRRRRGSLPAMPTAKVRCDTLAKKHQWREREERYSPWSTQSVGKYWVCVVCSERSDKKPAE
jgi:hypothetical protein